MGRLGETSNGLNESIELIQCSIEFIVSKKNLMKNGEIVIAHIALSLEEKRREEKRRKTHPH
jgi:hypothetical protein